jgi:hypothetical protein
MTAEKIPCWPDHLVSEAVQQAAVKEAEKVNPETEEGIPVATVEGRAESDAVETFAETDLDRMGA